MSCWFHLVDLCYAIRTLEGMVLAGWWHRLGEGGADDWGNENLHSTCKIYLYIMDIDTHKAVSFLPFIGCCPHTDVAPFICHIFFIC